MASAGSLLYEKHLLCSICLDVWTDPFTIPCGHNYCRTCITHYWDTNGVCQCPLCKETFDRRPKASVNTFISEMVRQFRSRKWQEEYEAKTEAEVGQMILHRRVKMQEFKQSVELSKKEASTAMADGVQIVTRALSTALVSCSERSQAELVAAIKQKHRTAEKRAQGVIEELREEITQLEKRSSELKRPSHTEEDRPPPPANKDWTNVNVHQPSYTGTVRTAVAQLEKTLIQALEKELCDVELRRIRRYAADVTLDPDTAHCELVLSEDGKQVNHGSIKKNLPNNDERYSRCPNVLGKQSVSSGRFYYEVQVEGKTRWDLGVARGSSERKGQVRLTPDDGLWTISLCSGNLIVNKRIIEDSGDAVLPVREKVVEKVGVFVDYEEGLVSFYDAGARLHLHSLTGCTFAEKLYPFLSPCFHYNGTNSAPLTISPVNTMGSADLHGEDDGNMSPPTSKRRK